MPGQDLDIRGIRAVSADLIDERVLHRLEVEGGLDSVWTAVR